MALARALPLSLLALAGCGGGEDRAETVRVPDVRAMQAGEAQHLLAAYGLRWREGDGPPEGEPASPQAPALVTGQRPAPGTAVARGTVVTLGEEPPARADEREVPYPLQTFRFVRPTADPAVVRVGLRPLPSCVRTRVRRTQIAGEVALALVRLELPSRRRCGREVPRELRVRFGVPVGERAVLPGPILRPRPTDGARPFKWERAVPVSPDGRTIGVAWTSGVPHCNAFEGVDAQEGADAVTITLRTGRPAGSDPERYCIAIGLPGLALVRLREPLGSRRLVDGAA
ncbi:MAG TPA: PASTA domain-containing protein [Solirubrobacteraceae bacterium]|nr:PASTA domain-containing protein [Solirubrobacteraceae bacterium]